MFKIMLTPGMGIKRHFVYHKNQQHLRINTMSENKQH